MTETERPAPVDAADHAGGDPACWVHLVCPECGAVTGEGHRSGCVLAPGCERPD